MAGSLDSVAELFGNTAELKLLFTLIGSSYQEFSIAQLIEKTGIPKKDLLKIIHKHSYFGLILVHRRKGKATLYGADPHNFLVQPFIKFGKSMNKSEGL